MAAQWCQAVAASPAMARNGDAQSRPAASGAVWRFGVAYRRTVIKDASPPHSMSSTTNPLFSENTHEHRRSLRFR